MTLQPPFSSNPVQRPEKKKKILQEGGKERKKQREPKPRRTRRSKERSSLERAHPNPRSSSSLASSPRADHLPLPQDSPAALRAAGERNSSSARPRLGSANPRLLPCPSRRSAQFPLFLGSDSVPSGARSSLPEIQVARALAGAGIMPPLL
jgi:hypothetical protein